MAGWVPLAAGGNLVSRTGLRSGVADAVPSLAAARPSCTRHGGQQDTQPLLSTRHYNPHPRQ